MLVFEQTLRVLTAVAAGAAAHSLVRAALGPGPGGWRLARLIGLAGGEADPGGFSLADGDKGGAGQGSRVARGPAGPGGEDRRPWWSAGLRRRLPGVVAAGLAGLGPGEAVETVLARRGLDPVDVYLAGLVGATAVALVLTAVRLLGGGGVPGWALAALAAAGILGPRLWLGAQASRHQAAVARELPRVAGLLALGTESGLELLEAIRLAAPLSPGPVGEALGRAMAEMDAGRETVPALRAVAARVGGPETRAFVASVVQGLELGAPVARVLRTLADSLVTKRRQTLEARINSLSLRLTVVTVTLFVPALLVLTVLPNLLVFLAGRW